MADRLNIAIIGATGYTGIELIRILAGHPKVRIAHLAAGSQAGQEIGAVFPALLGISPDILPDPFLHPVDPDRIAATAQVAFLGLPHATAAPIAAALLARGVKVLDLSADFRLKDPATYAAWYAHEHPHPELIPEAVYGLAEWAQGLPEARLIACPGCYPTSVTLPLVPLLKAGLIEPQVIASCASGTSGAGRSAKVGQLYAEVAEGFRAYGVEQHRHTPEITQTLTLAAEAAVKVTFTPHLLPIDRGILATLYIHPKPGVDEATLRQAWADAYGAAPLVRLLPAGLQPDTRDVRGTTVAAMALTPAREPGNPWVVTCAIDNLNRGASGQAVACLNLMMGWPIATGLPLVAQVP